jgi:hypothetical protein
MLAYLATASRYTYGQDLLDGTTLLPSYGMGLVGLAYSLFSSMRATLLALALPFTAVVLAGVGMVRSRREDQLLLGLLFSISGSAAFSLQLGNYDLAVLLVPMVLGLAWFGRTWDPTRALLLLPLIGFYFEFPFRSISMGDHTLNGSSFLFLAALGFLGWSGWHVLRYQVDPPT